MINVLDLFSGIGGFSLGLERAGMRTIAFCEIDKKCHLVLKKHWPTTPVYTDIKSLKGEMLSERVDIICGGFPCQDLSLAGKGAGLAGERSRLWWEFHRLIQEIKPKYAIIENVSALRSRGLDVVLRSLNEVGYDVQWHCIPASAIGAPHRRDRIWIIAYPNSEPAWGASNRLNCQQQDSLPQEFRAETRNGFTDLCKDVANPHNTGDRAPLCGANSTGETKEQGWENESFPMPCGCSEGLPNADCKMLERQRIIYERIKQELANPRYASRWLTESDVCRVADGIPRRVDRLRQLGNSIVPQIAQLIGEAIIHDWGRENA